MTYLKSEHNEQNAILVEKVFNQIEQVFGAVPEVFKMHAASPFFLKHLADMMGYLMNHDNLSKVFQGYIRLLISNRENGDYCIGFNTQILKSHGIAEKEIENSILDHTKARIDEKELCMLEFVFKVMYQADEVTVNDLNDLRSIGWTDCDIYDACKIGAVQLGNIQMIKTLL